MIAALTGMGLSAAAGLNAYIPFLVVALIARFSDVITLPASYAWIESWWAIGIGAVLLLTEVVLDKIPAVDTVNDAVQTFIRPSMGGLVFAATSAAEDLDQSTWMTQQPVGRGGPRRRRLRPRALGQDRRPTADQRQHRRVRARPSCRPSRTARRSA